MSDIEHLGREFMHTEDVQIQTAYVPKPPWMKKGLAIFVGLLLAVIIGEVVLRFMGYNAAEQKKRTDINTGLRVYAPGASITFREQCLTNNIQTNSLGFHSKEYISGKNEKTFRVVVVGDSFVEAAQVPVNQMFTSLLEDKLNGLNNGRRYEVIPFGISGNASYANLQYLKAYGLQFKPDLIIDAFFSNDVLADFYRPDNPSAAAPHDENLNLIQASPQMSADWKLKTRNYLKSLVKKSNIVLLTYSQYLNWRTLQNSRPVQDEPSEKQLGIDSEIYLADIPEFWQRAWKLQESIFKAFKQTAQANGARFVLVALPEVQRTHPDIGEEFLAQVPEADKLDLSMPDKQLELIAGSNGILFLAVQKKFTARAEKEKLPTYWPCDSHFNTTGHIWMADALYDFLIQNKLVE